MEKVTIENAEVSDEQKREQLLSRHLNVISCLIKSYYLVYYIDFIKDNYKEINPQSIKEVEQLIDNFSAARAQLRKMAETYVVPKYRDQVLEFTNLDTIADRLKDRDTLTIQFVTNNIGWAEGTFISSRRDEEGRCIRVVWAVRSIQEQKAKDERYKQEMEHARREAEKASNAKTAFLFNMSHDIRTPMNAIMGFRYLLEKYQDDPKRRADYLNKIESASNVLLSIINNVLEMARIEKGTLEIEETAWNGEQFNESLYSFLSEMMEQKGLAFTHQINIKNKYVFCDVIKLRKIFVNIISNAYKYTNPGGSVNMSVEELSCDLKGWVIYKTTITDTGIGMSEEFLPHIFEEFAREKNTTEGKVEGTGLGMPIVKRLVELLHGTIDVESKKGVGTKVSVVIPHRMADKSDLVVHAGVEIDPKLFKNKRILLAEDNDLNAEIATEILTEVGFVVERAEDGAVCVEKIKSSPSGYYDIILMDVQMPNMNGYEATRTIRTLSDTTKSKIKILAMTANAFREDKREALRAGMDGHIAKPIDVKELMTELANVLS